MSLRTPKPRLEARSRFSVLGACFLISLLLGAGKAEALSNPDQSGAERQDQTADPPFSGTIFIDPDIITEDDPTAFAGLADAGRGQRQMYDRRVPGWITVEAFLFDARYDDGLAIEIQVNPEFEQVDAARAEAARYAPVIGQLPTALRSGVETVWIHKGTELFGGGNNNLLIHTGQSALYEADGILEETFVHEAAHSSLDAAHAAAPGWLAAQAADGNFISTYARDNPNREDIAESFLPYLAARYRSDRVTEELARTIRTTIPNRMRYFDAQKLDLYPLLPRDSGSVVFLPMLMGRFELP